jgi:hypothetical protein
MSDHRRMTRRRLGLATLIALLAAPAAADAATFTQEGLPYAVGTDPYGVIAQDFNRDGLVDVATVNGTSSTLSVFMRQPTGGFAQQSGSPFATGAGPNFAASADFTGDGYPDVAVSNFNQGTVVLLVNQAGTGFSSSGVIGSGGRGVVTADFNGDTRPDLAATTNNGLVDIMLGQAGGEFSQATFGANPGANYLTAGDVDGDGDQDLAVANDSAGGVTILLNNGAGNFSAGASFVATGARPLSTAIADLNGDGRNDIAAANTGASTVSVLYRNAANSGFDAPTATAVPGGPLGLAVADFDANGTRDLAVASNAAGAVTILDSGAVAEAPVPFVRAYGLAVADFNRDGKPDLAVTGDTQNAFSVLLNTTAPPPPPPVQTPAPTPTVTATPTPVPPPVAGKSVNAVPRGKVKIKRPGAKGFTDLAKPATLPVGTTVDTRGGRVTLIAAGKGGQADFYDGLFKIGQTAGKRPLTTLTLTEPLSCPKAKRAASASASAKKKKTRKLWGKGKGAFRTQGKYSAATVRGTQWLVTDRCDSTTTRVVQGVVSVRDVVKRRTVTVRKGKSYTARRKR